MAGTVNRVILMGRLGADPDLKYTNNGTAVTNIRMATDRYYRPGQDSEADWHTVVAWGKSAEYLAERGHKGDLVHIMGRIVQNTWVSDDGQKRERTEIHTSELVVVGRPQTSPGPDIPVGGPAGGQGGSPAGNPAGGQAPLETADSAPDDTPTGARDLPF